uniref:Uncharacterized protein n=1 Tax=Panagrolaimus sp. ES5 TaxID=591445 RepID=A0AC34G5D7_9BILA
MYKAKLDSLELLNQILTFDEYLFLTSNAKKIKLSETTVKYSNGNFVEFEKLVQYCLNLETFKCHLPENSTIISPKTVKELIKFLPTSKIKIFSLFELAETFEKNKRISIDLGFRDSLSDEYFDQLEDVLCEIVETEKFEYSPPYIFLPGLTSEVQNFLYDIADSNNFCDK